MTTEHPCRSSMGGSGLRDLLKGTWIVGRWPHGEKVPPFRLSVFSRWDRDWADSFHAALNIYIYSFLFSGGLIENKPGAQSGEDWYIFRYWIKREQSRRRDSVTLSCISSFITHREEDIFYFDLKMLKFNIKMCWSANTGEARGWHELQQIPKMCLPESQFRTVLQRPLSCRTRRVPFATCLETVLRRRLGLFTHPPRPSTFIRLIGPNYLSARPWTPVSRPRHGVVPLFFNSALLPADVSPLSTSRTACAELRRELSCWHRRQCSSSGHVCFRCRVLIRLCGWTRLRRTTCSRSLD